YCRRYRPAARMAQPIDTSMCHLGFRCVVRMPKQPRCPSTRLLEASAMAQVDGLLELGAVFTLLFVTLGPVKTLGPFLQLTREVDDSKLKQIAVRAFVLAVIAV